MTSEANDDFPSEDEEAVNVQVMSVLASFVDCVAATGIQLPQPFLLRLP